MALHHHYQASPQGEAALPWYAGSNEVPSSPGLDWQGKLFHSECIWTDLLMEEWARN